MEHKIDIKTFLMGYFYAAFQLYNHHEKSQSSTDFYLGQIYLYTINGGKLTVGVNRGICPIGGNTPFAFSHTEKSLFDVVEHWTVPEIWKHLADKYNASHGEVRITLDNLINTIELFGGLDFEKMKQLPHLK